MLARTAVIAILASVAPSPALAQAPGSTQADAASAPAPGDAAAAPETTIVRLRSGATFRGTVEGRDERVLRLRSPAGTVREIPLSAIASIEGPAGAPAAASREAPPSSDPAAGPSGPAAPPRVGLGVAFGGSGFLGPRAILVPIDLAIGLRIEPEVLLGYDHDAEATLLGGGVGLFGLSEVAPQVRGSFGLRVEAWRLSDPVATASAWRAALAVGAEWAPVPQVSLGVEAQVGYEDGSFRSSSGPVFVTPSSSGLSTSALAVLRVALR